MVQKKDVYDKVMLVTRLKEEQIILVREVKQHCEYLKRMAQLIQELIQELSEGTTVQSKSFFSSCLWKWHVVNII